MILLMLDNEVIILLIRNIIIINVWKKVWILLIMTMWNV